MIRPVGVSLAVKADEYPQDRDTAKAFMREVYAFLTDRLRTYTGQATPVGADVAFRVDGPNVDPLQGAIYVLSVSAMYNLDTLPTDSPAALNVRVNGVT